MELVDKTINKSFMAIIIRFKTMRITNEKYNCMKSWESNFDRQNGMALDDLTMKWEKLQTAC
jgi:hypothetical protein